MFDTTEQSGLQFPTSVPLAEKYRPRTIGEFIGLEKPRKVISGFAKRPTSCAWVFVGPSGVGKSTLALALATELKADFHHIPSQRCNVETINETVRMCWYVPRFGAFHLVLVDEADKMTPSAQLALLSKLDSTDPPPNTIFVFTCNQTDLLEARFLSRTRVLEFSSYGMRDALASFLKRVWEAETSGAPGPDFARMAKDSCNNVRDALNTLEVELLSRDGEA